jgi:hypothetical protein
VAAIHEKFEVEDASAWSEYVKYTLPFLTSKSLLGGVGMTPENAKKFLLIP